jgi:DNA-binding transcriptional MerR regulator
MAEPARWRIGELSRRTGVSTQMLRAWERRYGLLEPRRTGGGFRLYSAADEARVRRVLALRAAGHSTAEAAAIARAEAPDPAGPGGTAGGAELDAIAARLRAALEALDEGAAHAALDSLLAATDLETALTAVLLPELADLGERWAAGTASVADEHYASQLIQGRLLAWARGWDQGGGARAVLACAPGELHALGLIAFGLILHRRGWRIAYLGADTPVDSLEQAAAELQPAAVVVAAVIPERFESAADGLRALSARTRLALGGAGSSAGLAARLGAEALDGDPVGAARELSLTSGS